MYSRKKLEKAMIDEDFDYLLGYLNRNTHRGLPIDYNNPEFDISYRLIDFLYGTEYPNSGIDIRLVSMGLFSGKNVEKMTYIIDTYLKNNDYIKNVYIDGFISSYASKIVFYSDYEYRSLFLFMLQYIIDNISISFNNIIPRDTDAVKDYVIIQGNFRIHEYNIARYDAISYVAFRIMSDQLLESTSNYILENLIYIMLRCNTSEVLIDTLVKYLDDASEYKSYNFRESLEPKENYNYISLFSEDI